MRFALRLVLILTLMLTGIGLGAARGTAQINGRAVLCTGDGVVLHYLPGQDGPQRAHICPDMALALLLAQLATPPIPAIRPQGRCRSVPFAQNHDRASCDTPAPAARDPPVSLITI